MIVAVVTGAAMGIGQAIATRLIADGTTVIGVDRNGDALEAFAAGQNDRLLPVVGDIGDWQTHERAADAAEAAGELRGWVNNAGADIAGGAHEVGVEEIASGLRVLQMGPMFGAAASFLIAAGADVKTLTTLMGHGSARMSLDTYGHLFDGAVAETALRVDAWLKASDTQQRIAQIT